MKRYLYGAVIKSVSGSQTFYIDAASQEEADERAREGDTDGIHSEDVEVTDLYELEPCGVTNLGDFGDFPPDAAQAAQQHPIDEAIVILTEEADSLSECHTRTPGDWAGEPEAKARYDHILAIVGALSKLRAPVADERAALEWYAEHVAGCRKLGPDGDAARQALDKDGGERARAALASAPVADESPMAKMADVLREKARKEQQAYQDRRNQATEWGPMPEGTEADHPIPNAPVAHVAGNEASRYLEWAKDRSAWEMPVGTPVYYSALASAPVAGEAQLAEDALKQVYDRFGIGVLARNPSTLMACLGNVIRRANCLSQVERVLSVPTPPEPEDDGVWGEESLLRWGADEKGYGEHFKAALAEWLRRTPMPEEPVYAYRRKGLDDFVTCDRERFDELSAKPRLFETRIFYTAPQASEADPLQGAADWLMRAFEPPLSASDLARQLVIGYNRATRLRDAALTAQPGAKK